MQETELEKKNYYELLGLDRSATVDQIKEAYREIARIYHPDSNYYGDILSYGLNERDNMLFRLVTAAYDTLIKPEKRAKYDLSLPPELKSWDDEPYKDQRQGAMREWNAPSSAEEVDLLRTSKLRAKTVSEDGSDMNKFSGLHQKVAQNAQSTFGRESQFVQEMSREKYEHAQRIAIIAGAFFAVALMIALVLVALL